MAAILDSDTEGGDGPGEFIGHDAREDEEPAEFIVTPEASEHVVNDVDSYLR
jgi:hypothetical protein